MCKACIEVKAMCRRLGAEESEKVTKKQRKAEEESPRGKRKWTWMMEELEVGLSRIRGAEYGGGMKVMEGVAEVLREIRDAMRANNR